MVTDRDGNYPSVMLTKLFAFRKVLPSRRRRQYLTQEQRAHWEQNGFLILPRFFSDTELDSVDVDIERFWNDRSDANPLVVDVTGGCHKGQRVHQRTLSPDNRQVPHKLNDLYLESEPCRSLVLEERLTACLRELLNDEPVVINSLGFTQGSQQDPHFDTYFMPPPVENQMVVSSICFEDTHPDAGPLTYYPGSHRLEPFRFANGSLAPDDESLSEATAYVRDLINEAGIEPATFIGSKGDVFLWHAQLYHGGLPIVDSALTRRTLVTHYWGQTGVSGEIRTCSTGGQWLARSHQPVPG
jgi:phytanoyl-CoA hydroxylase